MCSWLIGRFLLAYFDNTEGSILAMPATRYIGAPDRPIMRLNIDGSPRVAITGRESPNRLGSTMSEENTITNKEVIHHGGTRYPA